MNISWGNLMVLFFCLLGSVNNTFAENRLPDSTFKDWTGVSNEIEMSDGSTLFEYAARSFSGSTEGAKLSLIFVPRFNCAPTVTVRMPDNGNTVNDRNSLLVSVDGVGTSYNFVADREPGFIIYSIAATVDELVELRENFDKSSRVSISVMDNAPEDSTVTRDPVLGSSRAVTFSMFGSKLATLAVDTHCRSHKPLSFVRQ